MIKIIKYTVFIAVVLSLNLSCVLKESVDINDPNISASDYTNVSNDDVVNIVRSVVISQIPELSNEEKMTIMYIPPETGVYKMGGPFGQYIWSWELSKGQWITVSYIGSLSPTIDTSQFEVKKSDSY